MILFSDINPFSSNEFCKLDDPFKQVPFRMKRLFILVCLLLQIFPNSLKSQILRDSSAMRMVREDIDYIYDFKFKEARELYGKITAIYPEHPVVYLLQGMITYWENYPLLDNSKAKEAFESDMKECIRLSEKHTSQENEAEYLLADLCGRGFLLLFYSGNNLVAEVIPVATGTYKYLMRSFHFTSTCTDLYYYTGIYNYYREAYPRIYPVYRPLAMLFPQGNMKEGLKQLKIASAGSVVMSAESTSILSYIYSNFENDYSEALSYSKELHGRYPGNTEFTSMYIRNLLLLKKYDAADTLISSELSKSGSRYYEAQLSIFMGIIMDKKYFEKKSAREFYSKGIREIAAFGKFGNEYAAYGYFGLSRISAAEGEKHASHIYRKEAIRLADFDKIDFN
jgi:hypothetical protein